MKKILLTLILLIQIPAHSADTRYLFENDKGFTTANLPVYTIEGVKLDGRGQVPEYSRIEPPHPENIPSESRMTHTIEPYDSYYYSQVLGWRRPMYQEPIVPGYNIHYSTRIAKPYTHREYLDVWCEGDIDYNQNMCSTDTYDIYFVHARNWAARATTIPLKIRQAKTKGHKVGLFLEVDEIGRDSEHVTDAKRFAALWNLPIFAATIDSYLPLDWFVD